MLVSAFQSMETPKSAGYSLLESGPRAERLGYR